MTQKGNIWKGLLEIISIFLLSHPTGRSSLSPSPASGISSQELGSQMRLLVNLFHIYDDDSELNEAAARFTLGSPLTSPGGSQEACPGEESPSTVWTWTFLSP